MTLRQVADPDLGWVLRTGEVVLHGHLPRTETWSWTASGTPWVAHSWGAATLMAGLVRGLGIVGGLAVWQLLTVGGAFAILAVDGRLRTGRTAPALVGTAAVAVGLITYATPRTALAGWPFLAAEAVWWAQARTGRIGRSPVWLLVGAQAGWACLHGSSVLGVALPVALFVATLPDRGAGGRDVRRELRRRVGWRMVGQILTPYGVAGALHAWTVIGRSTNQISEYASPDLHTVGDLVTVLLAGAVLARACWRRRPVEALVAAGLLLAGLISVRYFVVALLVAGPDIIDAVAGVPVRVRRRVPVLAAVVLTAFAAAQTRVALSSPLSSRFYPLGAADWLAEHPEQGRPLFNPYAAGGWLGWRARHGERVAQDGRNDVYPVVLLQRLADAEALRPGWEQVVDPDAGLTVVTRTDSPLSAELGTRPTDWRPAYRDRGWAVYVPVREASRPLPDLGAAAEG